MKLGLAFIFYNNLIYYVNGKGRYKLYIPLLIE